MMSHDQDSNPIWLFGEKDVIRKTLQIGSTNRVLYCSKSIWRCLRMLCKFQELAMKITR